MTIYDLIRVALAIGLIIWFYVEVFYKRQRIDSLDILGGNRYLPEPLGNGSYRVYDLKTGKVHKMKSSEAITTWRGAIYSIVARNIEVCKTTPKYRLIIEKHYPDVYKELLCLSKHCAI